MTETGENRHAIIVLPPGCHGKVLQARQRRWLSRGTVSYAPPGDELLNRVLPLINHAPLATGFAALRFWGQNNERVSTWMAAADPVYLETMRDNLRLHSLSTDELDSTEVRNLFDGLQHALGGDRSIAFASVELCGYLRGNTEMGTANVSAQTVHGATADEYMPPAGAAASYHRLFSEIQMYLHQHDVNVRRDSEGMKPVNCLWLWGGGRAPEKSVRPIPPLFSADPLFRGYWESCTGVVESWSGNFEQCLDLAKKDFVVVTTDVAGEARQQTISECLDALRSLLARRQLKNATLLFRDGLSVEVGRYDWLKFWRRDSELFTQAFPHE